MELTINRLLFIATAVSLLFIVQTSELLAEEHGQIIRDVRLDRASFNPAQGGEVHIGYKLTQPSDVTIRVYDPDGGLVRTLVEDYFQDAGPQQLVWYGCDDTGKAVPDEAYTFTVEAAAGAVFDPTTFSGGVVADITDAKFGRDGVVVYKLPHAARVMSRLGVTNGPMLKTLVDWKPRVTGEVTEYWDWKDEDKIISLRDNPKFSSLITYVTLPEATVIAYGNKQESSYRDYKLGRGKTRMKKPERERLPDAEGRLAPKHLVPPAWARAPQVQMIFPAYDKEEKQGNVVVPEVNDVIDVRINVEASDREFLLKDQFEVIFYLDNVFFAEAERGYLPLNWHWELQQVPPGEHILTVNISSFSGQVGVASRKIRVAQRKQ